ncbi:SCP2 sterol-binding domain-containing protein [Streptomyces sp. NA04227]|uniref:SCP2 sterol-binding domain-containing protein n=1 Tax=Streptomyces sp. NA04227 TaxID=2742136 RepID=UPI0015900F97|nr:SCP2 sterol-binding domain-containing protein [Streptomyces sp. NA04227]QKW09781.1 SCP2 sterol-binding domain-containing protein [Streptomyces sp. NA04227]
MNTDQVCRLISRLSDSPTAAEAYKAVGASTRFVIDSSREIVLNEDGSVRTTTDEAAPDLTVRISGEDAAAIIAGGLSVIRSITSGRVAAEGPIFQSIGVVRSLSQLSNEEV